MKSLQKQIANISIKEIKKISGCKSDENAEEIRDEFAEWAFDHDKHKDWKDAWKAFSNTQEYKKMKKGLKESAVDSFLDKDFLEFKENVQKMLYNKSLDRIEDMKKETADQMFNSSLSEQEEWSKDVDVEEGKMHDLLNIPSGQKISDVYTDPEALADDLVNATGNEKEAASMLAFVANINSEEDIFDEALSVIGEKDYS